MILLAIFSLLAIFMTAGVECGYASVGSSSTSSSDGSGQTFTQTSNNGQGQFTYTQNKPGSVPIIATGNLPPNSIPPNSIPPYFGPANFGQPSFGYGPSYPFNPYGSMAPAFTPYPQQPAFGFNSPFQPLQPLSPYQPFNTFLTPTPQEFSAYLNAVQQQYNTYYKQQQDILNSWKNTPFVAGYSGVPNYAYATGAFGPNGIHQTAGVFPPNKNKPNVDNRFDPNDSTGNNAQPGFFGIQTSSFSTSSDVNGKKTHKEGASTTVNDNGKVTTYNVEN